MLNRAARKATPQSITDISKFRITCLIHRLENKIFAIQLCHTKWLLQEVPGSEILRKWHPERKLQITSLQSHTTLWFISMTWFISACLWYSQTSNVKTFAGRKEITHSPLILFEFQRQPLLGSRNSLFWVPTHSLTLRSYHHNRIIFLTNHSGEYDLIF